MSFLACICKDGMAGQARMTVEPPDVFLSRAGIRRDLPRAAPLAALIPAAAPPFGLYLVSPLAPLADETEFSSLADKAGNWSFRSPTISCRSTSPRRAWSAASFSPASQRAAAASTPAGGLAVALTALLFLAAPFAFKGTYLLDTRFVIMLGFLLFGAVLPYRPATRHSFCRCRRIHPAVRRPHGRWRRGLRGTNIGETIAALRAVIAIGASPDDRVFVAAVSPEEAPRYWRNAPLSRQLSFGLRLDAHLPALLLIERRAYWPFLFDNPSQQPVATLPPYRELAERTGSIADHRALTMPGKLDLCGFDHLLLLDAGGEPDLAHFVPDRLMLIAASDVAALFRVRQGACSR